MATHLRFKQHLRFLREGEVIRVVRALDGEATLPSGEGFDHLLAALEGSPEENSLRADLSQRMNVDAPMIDGLLNKLYELKLIERFDPEEKRFARFDRQLLLFDALQPADDRAENIARQQRLKDAHVLVLGLGGIGHQVALSLVAAGVGSITLVDGDVVEESNLHRQILFTPADVDGNKVAKARNALERIAPECLIHTTNRTIRNAEDWRQLTADYPSVRHVMLCADKPVQLVNWISDARTEFNYHFIKCGYMSAQGLIGPLLGPDTKGYEELFSSWGPLIDAQPENIKAFNSRSTAPTMAASNAIMANIAALEMIKHITGIGELTLLGKRLLLDLNTYTTHFG